MLLSKRTETTTDEFWRDFEEKTGEKVLSRGLGKYICGWEEFDEKKWNGIWGLLITTSGGFRFHHFPQYSWIDSITHAALTARSAKKEKSNEKTIFIPQKKIAALEYVKETRWWKKIFSPSPPRLFIRYLDETITEDGVSESVQSEKRLIFEAEYDTNLKG